MKRATLRQLLADQAAKRPVALLTRLTDGSQALVYEDRDTGGFDEGVVAAARRALIADCSGPVGDHGGQVFIQVFNPPLRMIVVGAVHIAQALVPMAQLAGYAVVVIDPRRAWASTERFPGVIVSDDWPDAALAALEPDRRTAVVTLSHDPKLDDPALTVALRSPAFYVGALGSRRTHASRLQRLREAGLGEAELARIHAPVGLPIGARSPAEIAIAVLAQITQVRQG